MFCIKSANEFNFTVCMTQVQGSVRKLADSIQTVKTVLGMKIQSEQKLVGYTHHVKLSL